jgi:hypothetical protein
LLWATSTETFWTKIFLSGTDGLKELDDAVGMMWDMGSLEGAAMFPGEEHLVDPIFSALGTARRCRSKSCQGSALHGLGHLERYHPDRVHALIDWARKAPNHLAPSLFSYAHYARESNIQ